MNKFLRARHVTSEPNASHRNWYRQIISREGTMRPKTDGILESSLYVSDVSRSIRFYQKEACGSTVQGARLLLFPRVRHTKC